MTKVSAALVAAVAGLFALGGCSIDTSGLPAVSGVEDDASAGGKQDTGGGLGGTGGHAGAGGAALTGGAGGTVSDTGGQAGFDQGGNGPGGSATGGSEAGGSGGSGQGGQGGTVGGGGGTGAVGGGAGGGGLDAGKPDLPAGLLGNGALCTVGNACTSGSCVDGVCCESACAGTCMACAADKTGQLDGQCRTVTLGTDPDNECDVETGNACGRTGRCGIGACEVASKGTSCGDRSCVGHQITAAPTCSGGGQCISPAASACPGALKCASATACATTCAADTDCVGNWICDKVDGTCKPGLSLGAVCDPAATEIAKQCMSGHCVDGFCCDTACGAACMACAAAKTNARNGLCAPVTAGTDPDNECAAQDPSTCGNSGTCNGSGACKKYPDGTVCGTACCTNNSGPGGGARLCGLTCRAGHCDAGNPVPQESCNGQTPCCCTGGNSANACASALACVLGGGTCS